MIWPSCTWRETANPVTLQGGCTPLSSLLTCVPGLAYLDVMALRDHDIFLGEQVLDSILGDDVLYLRKGGEEAGAGAPLLGSSARKAEQGGQGHPVSNGSWRRSLESTVPPTPSWEWGLEVGGRRAGTQG